VPVNQRDWRSGTTAEIDAAVGDEYNQPNHIDLTPVYSPHSRRLGTDRAEAGPDTDFHAFTFIGLAQC